MAEYLFSAGIDLNRHGERALQTAAFAGHLEIVKILINNNVDINYQSFDGNYHDDTRTPLHSAASNQYEVVQYLLEKGADTRLKEHYVEKAYHMAKFQNKDIAALIKKYEPVDLHDYDKMSMNLKK